MRLENHVLTAVLALVAISAGGARADECDALAGLHEGAQAIREHVGGIPFTVVLPPGYDPGRDLGYPVSYVVRADDADPAACLATSGLVASASEESGGSILVVVDGSGGMASDWRSGAPLWQSLHVRTLIPYVDAKYRTVGASGAYRAVSGTSKGGVVVTMGDAAEIEHAASREADRARRVTVALQ